MNSFKIIKTVKRAAALVLMTGVALGVNGCATIGANSGPQASGRMLDEELVGAQAPQANTVYAMARLLRVQDKTEQAEIVLLKLIRDFPSYAPGYNDMCEIRISQNRLGEAVTFLNAGLVNCPNDPILLNNAGVCALLQEENDDAIQYFKRASTLAPYDQRYRANHALALGLNGEIESAEAMYAQIVSTEDAAFNASLIYQLVQQGIVEEALAYELLELNNEGSDLN